jgi:hypothetical protein
MLLLLPPPPPLLLEAAAAEAVAPVCAAGDGAEPSSPFALRPKQQTSDMKIAASVVKTSQGE